MRDEGRGARHVVTRVALALGALGCQFNADDPRARLPVVSQAVPPPAVSGGTLLALRDGRRVVASDPDRDVVHIVDLPDGVVRTVALAGGDEPGRAVQDASGAVHVLLRRAGAVATIDPDGARVVARRAVCEAPRGLDVDRERGRLFVACARGELVSFDLSGEGEGEARRVRVGDDLRDVVVWDGRVMVSRFRSADVLFVGDDGAVTSTFRPASATLRARAGTIERRYDAAVAWRLRATPRGPVMVHQRAFVGPEEASEAAERYSYSREQVGWVDPCDNAVVHASVTLVPVTGQGGAAAGPSITRGVLPVDVAASSRGDIAVAFAGEMGEFRVHGPQVVVTTAAFVATNGASNCVPEDRARRYPGQVVALAYTASDELVVQTREPASVVAGGRVIALGGAERRDTGHEVFHADVGGGIACASCHPEGGDDAHVWNFRETGPRRTLGLEGALRVDGPFHWRGDVPNFRALMGATLARMNGPSLGEEHLRAAQRWASAIPAPPRGSRDAAAVARGAAVFARGDVGCAGCHAGLDGSDGRVHAVRGGAWRTPPLRGAGMRGRYLHDGSARSLGDAVRAHRDVRALAAGDWDDLLIYLDSL